MTVEEGDLVAALFHFADNAIIHGDLQGDS